MTGGQAAGDSVGPLGAERSVLSIRSATLGFGERTLWDNLNLEVGGGEFLAVLGGNGTGKTSLLKAILGQQDLDSGTIMFDGHPVSGGSREIGYIPQQKILPPGTPLRAKDLIALGVDGHRWGLPIPTREVRRRVGEVLVDLGAVGYANEPVALLSGGEQQRLRVGQAIAANPKLILCDEPLLSLDLHHQRSVSELIDLQRTTTGASVVFVTHDVNPILPFVDRVLYLAGGQFQVGTPDEVLRSEVLSALYDTPVEVIRSRGRIAVLGVPEGDGAHDHHDQHEDAPGVLG